MNNFYCYCLESNSKKRSYVGATKNPKRRLKQHNGIIKGGSKYCRKDRPWKFMIKVTGFDNYVQALQFEWAWKNQNKYISKKDYDYDNVIEKRLIGLEILIHKERWTSNSPLSKNVSLIIYINDKIKIPNNFDTPKNIKIMNADDK